MNKKTSLIFLIFLSFSFQANAQINEFECSPSEMAKVLERDGKDRLKQTQYKDFIQPYQEAVVQDVANQITEETGVPTSAADVTSDDLKEKNQDFSCMNVDFNKIGENIMGAVDKVGALLSDGIAKAGDIVDDVMEDLSKGFCSKAAKAVADFAGQQLDEIGERAKSKMESKIREDRLLKLLDEGNRNYLINEQINETFGDKHNMLEWRDNKIDKDVFKKSVNSQWSKELEDLYDDFDDQVDEKIDN